MRKVGVHLEDVFVVALQRPAESRQVRRAQPHLLRAMQRMHAIVACRDLVDDGAGAVRRAVIDHQHRESRILREHGIDDPGDVLALVVRGDDDQSTFAAAHFPGGFAGIQFANGRDHAARLRVVTTPPAKSNTDSPSATSVMSLPFS